MSTKGKLPYCAARKFRKLFENPARRNYAKLSLVNVIKLGKKGQVSIPKAVLNEVGLEGDTLLLVEAADDGAIILRPAGVYPIEMYSDERVREFLEADELTTEEKAAVSRKLAASETVS